MLFSQEEEEQPPRRGAAPGKAMGEQHMDRWHVDGWHVDRWHVDGRHMDRHYRCHMDGQQGGGGTKWLTSQQATANGDSE